MSFIKYIIFSPYYIIKGFLDFIQNYFKSLVFLLILFLIFFNSGEELKKPNLIKIELSGPIISAKEFLEKIDEAKKPNYKGVLVEVNSPGGSVSPSIEMAMAIKRLRDKKPVVVYANGTMASGSYYASIYANKIISNPGSIIGSIGVIFQGLNAKELLDTIGLKPQVVNAGKYKQVGTPLREWTDFEKEEIKKVIDDTYDMFVKDVALARSLDLNKSSIYADAHIFSAKEAKDIGLIDEIGTFEDAKELLKTLSKVSDDKWKEEDKIDKLLKKFASKASLIIYNSIAGLEAY